MDDKEIKFEIVEKIGVLSEGNKGWRREINQVSWNGREAKLDLRDWSEDHLRMGKGVTLSREEAQALVQILADWLKK
jgi:hypothetical protein